VQVVWSGAPIFEIDDSPTRSDAGLRIGPRRRSAENPLWSGFRHVGPTSSMMNAACVQTLRFGAGGIFCAAPSARQSAAA